MHVSGVAVRWLDLCASLRRHEWEWRNLEQLKQAVVEEWNLISSIKIRRHIGEMPGR
ncbi:uncharacterized protein K452DRAFT_291534 [Aplosporella prunicola CBS 121167]|uniref:Uncharacterized protein n=1 Tax=Aplosporella prunicola CBS 121167 TaxID=1176127 RepID=A0A6A6B0V6_9PEZI|nr:uncharacterized protein K452DRAFT_291534 [Aplosporella prunicola CBS 121167]KAF2137486.1 hypothetical protein K452DRAFT_291534 [Aplosporella prunicola CBS 121167]